MLWLQSWVSLHGEGVDLPLTDTFCPPAHTMSNLAKESKPSSSSLEEKLSPDQLVLLLESLLQKRTFCSQMLEYLQKTYHLREQDAEIRHRWCELIIKHKHVAGYADVEKFLKEDQAMGVYLYGELMLNEDAKQQEIAYKAFAIIRDQMDTSSAKVVAEMLSDKERQRL